MDDNQCLVIEISRGTTHDGPGMRTTVFFKGCPLRCLWCQNPEGMKAGQEIWWEERKCIHCLSCVEACPQEGITEGEGGLVLAREKCTLCGTCVEECPSTAMAFVGQEWSLDGLVKEVLKDRDYYRAFGGGVTVSGGEPLAQYRFVRAFFERLQQEGIHTALDTCGLASPEAVAAVLPFTDHVLFDIKLINSEQHRALTGHPNGRILENLQTIATHLRAANGQKKMWIRTPLIPGATATEQNIGQIGAYIQAQIADVVERWELCAFNPACKNKYHKMGQEWVYADCTLMEAEGIETLKRAATAAFPAEKLVVSGLIAREAAKA